MTTVCSSRTSLTVARKSRQTTGWNTVTRGNSNATTRAIKSVLVVAFSRKVKTRWIENRRDSGSRLRSDNPGYDTDATNTLRLWSAQASSEINLGKFNGVTTSRQWKIKTTPRTYLAYCIRMTPPTPGVSCACVRNTSGFLDHSGHFKPPLSVA